MNKGKYYGRIRQSIRMIGIKSHIKYLDIGCGTGWSLEHVCQDNSNFVVGLDNNAHIIHKLSKKNRKYNCVIGSAINLPFKENIFQLITVWEVLEHIPIRQEKYLLKEVYRCLVNSGNLLLSTPSWNIINNVMDPAWYFGHRHYTISELQKLCKKACFGEIKIDIRGGFGDLLATLLFYIEIHIIKKEPKLYKIFNNCRDKEYENGGGIATLFGLCTKNQQRASDRCVNGELG